MRKGLGLLAVSMLALTALGWTPAATHAASSFAIPAFKEQWEAGEAITPNFWGPLETAKEKQLEPYDGNTTAPLCPPNGPCPTTVPLSERTVQYFDKGRIEITRGRVTNGLLATEIVKGQIQIGDTTFQPKAPPAIPIAGDPDNAGPTYAAPGTTAASLLGATPAQTGNAVTTTVAADGTVTAGIAGSGSGPMALTVYDGVTQHNVPQAFAQFRDKVGLLTVGYAKSEPFLATVKVAGQQRQVMVQVFERRVLTYTASNPAAFQVEMGNIGQHYYRWRYCTP